MSVLTVVLLLVLLFAGYRTFDYVQTERRTTGEKAGEMANRVVNVTDERLENLWQYYISAATNDDVVSVLQSKSGLNDYDHVKKVQTALAGTNLFSDYITGYTLCNFKSGWIVSNKGMYPLEECLNREILDSLFEQNNNVLDKNYWYYDASPKNINQVSREYRTTIETNGLNIVIKLPSAKVDVYALLLANVNLDKWKEWTGQFLDADDELVVLDENDGLIYATSQDFIDECIDIATNGSNTPVYLKGQAGEKSSMVDYSVSQVLGWKYFVLRKISGNVSYNTNMIIGFSAAIIIIFAVFSYLIYKPIGRLVKNVFDGEKMGSGNELAFMADRYEGVKADKQSLQNMLGENRAKIQELFELRLIRGEVRNDEEWNEYFEGLHMEPYTYFSAAVMVINVKGEDDEQDTINEDAVCIKLVDNLPKRLAELTWMPLVYNACTMFCIFADNDEESMLKKITDFYEGMQSYAMDKFGVKLLMGVSATHTEHRHVYAAYRESLNAITMTNNVTDASDEGSAGADASSNDIRFYLTSMTKRGANYDTNLERDVQNAIKVVDKDQCYRTIDEFYGYLSTLNSHDDSIYSVSRMISSILEAAVMVNLNLKEVFPDGVRKLYREAMEVTEPARIRRYLKYAAIDPILAARTEKLSTDSGATLDRMDDLIRARKGNISLQEFADELGVNQTYIWKVLKMEKGFSFSEYVENYKLEAAKEMLLKTDMAVNDIAMELGYTNAQNFIRFFSKGTGLTPGKFRKLS